MLPVRRQLKHTYSLNGEKRRVLKRIIDRDEWIEIHSLLESMPETTDKECWDKVRLRWLIALGYFTTMRNGELASTTMGGFWKAYDSTAQKYRWWLTVSGKGQKLRDIPVNQSLFDALVQYRRFLNLTDEPESHETEPLIRSLNTKKAISDRRHNQLIKALTHRAAERFELLRQTDKAARLRKFSVHWLRHLSCSMQASLNFQKVNIKGNAGHENESTTDLYIHAFDNARHEEMENLVWLPSITAKE